MLIILDDQFDRQRLQRFHRALRNWYVRNARTLPWRQVSDPYPIWISEIMLQQTTVTAVIPYFERFLNRFPTLATLAAADEQEVLRYWEGLGYYSRARNIHKTAKQVLADHAGEFPSEVASLMELPGIGRYTAGAIASFAFDRRAAILEANTLRLYSRLLGLREDPRSKTGQERLWAFAEHILPRKNPGLFNQALMELGATVCTPGEPRCDACPVRTCCAAFANGLQHEIPVLLKRPKVTEVVEISLAIQKGQKYLLRRRLPGERWAGLWDFPRFTWGEPREGGLQADELDRWTGCEVLNQFAIQVGPVELLHQLRHSVTRYRITLLCCGTEYLSGKIPDPVEHDWVTPSRFEDFPLSVTGRKFAQFIVRQHA